MDVNKIRSLLYEDITDDEALDLLKDVYLNLNNYFTLDNCILNIEIYRKKGRVMMCHNEETHKRRVLSVECIITEFFKIYYNKKYDTLALTTNQYNPPITIFIDKNKKAYVTGHEVKQPIRRIFYTV